MFPSRTKPEIVNIHASCVTAGNGGVLILGNSGQGKSDLALRLIDQGARLVADDRCDIWYERERLWCRPPENLAGKLEVRGIGIIERPWTAPAPIGAAWGAGWMVSNGLLVVALIVIDLLIYLPFFKVYEKQLLEQEAEMAAEMEASAA